MSKKTPIVALAAIISIFAATSAFATFQDVSSTHVNSDAINYMETSKIVEGYPDGSFQPDRTINRAEFTKIIVGAYFDKNDIEACKTSSLKFTDTDSKAWYASFICHAVEKGIIQGYPDNTFKPAQDITFVEAAKIVYIASASTALTDPIWYKPYVEELEKTKAIPESISKFEHKITRGEMAEITYRRKESITNKASLTYAELAKKSGISIPAPSQPAAPANVFNTEDVKLGDTVGGFKVSSITKRADITEFTFEGQVDVTGKYTHHDQNAPHLSGMICMEDLTTESIAKIPTLNVKNDAFFCFSNKDFAEKNLAAEGSSGTATVTIDEYTISAVKAGDPVDSAQLVKVLVKQETVAAPENKPKVIVDPAKQNVIDTNTVKVGDKAGDWTVKAITVKDVIANPNEKETTIEFTGEITLSGVSELKAIAANPTSGYICMSGFNLDEINKIPVFKGTDLATVEVCFSNNDFAKQNITSYDQRRFLKVQIKDFTLTSTKDFQTYFTELKKVEVNLELPKLLENINGLKLLEENNQFTIIDPNANLIPLQP